MKNYTITVNGNIYDVVVEEGSVSGLITPNTENVVSNIDPITTKQKKSVQVGGVEVKSGTAGKVVKIAAELGQSVKAGDPLVIIEAMKMEIPIVASVDGTVVSIHVSDGESIEAGVLLATLNEA